MKPAALLLEVVIALAVMTAALGLLGAQLAGGLDMTGAVEDQLNAALLGERALTLVQLDRTIQERIKEAGDVEATLEDRFGSEYPGYFWRVNVRPVDRQTQDLSVVTVEVLRQPDARRADSPDGATVIRRLAFLKAPPARLDLVEDGGLDEGMVEQLRQMVQIPDFDPRAVDLQQLAALDPETLMQLLPQLTALLGMAGQLSGGDLSGLQTQLGQLPPDAQQQLGQLLDGAGGPGGSRPPGVPGPRGGRGPQAGAGGAPPMEGGGPPRGMRGNRGNRGNRGGGDAQAGGGLPDGGLPDGGPPGPRAGGGRRGGGGAGPGGGQGLPPGQGSGPGGRYTIEDLMRMRDEARRQGGG